MSRLHPSLLPLDKGLNLQAPKILAPEGSVLDSLNYEQVDFQGQKRIEGYARYDGSVLSSFDDFILLPSDTEYTQGSDGRGLSYNATSGKLFGIQLGFYGETDEWIVFAVLDETALPASYEWGRDVITDPQEHYTLVLGYHTYVRNLVEELPGGVIGLHWFRDRLYAVADLRVLQIADDAADILPNDIVELDGISSTVLDIAVGTGLLYVLVPSLVEVVDLYVVRTATSYTVVANRAGIMASFFESRTEAQVIEEDTGTFDFGWRFNHLGWNVPFIEGSSLYGSLTSLNQNRQGVGIQGPTSIAGNSGKPLVLTQKVNITNLPAQVNGWKTSTSPSVFNLEADALEDVDSYTIYADAYFSWDGITGIVTAPGITGEGLIEYPASNNVVVDV